MGVLLTLMLLIGGWVLLGPWTLATAWEIGLTTKGGMILGSFGAVITALGLLVLKHVHFKKR